MSALAANSRIFMDNQYKLFDAEYKFLNLIWDNEPVNSTELVKICLKQLGWKKSTTYTMIKKLSERGFLQNSNAIVTTLIKREEVLRHESNQVVEKSFDGSLPKFLTAFLGDKKLSKKEAEELKRIIEEVVK